MIEKALLYIEKHTLIQPNSTLIVGLSGGPDSVCLLHILKQMQPRFNLTLIAAHLDHEWRTNSAQDALFCKEYAQGLEVPFIEAKASDLAQTLTSNGSKEELGRMLRHSFFQSLAVEHNTHSLALGHHKDDQQETFFIRLIRGASIAGLAGMKPHDNTNNSLNCIRPLLAFYKHEILEYLEKNNLTYVQDPTNEHETFLRNALRIKVLPALRSCDERFDKTFEKTHTHIQETHEFIERLTKKTFEGISTTINGEQWISLEKFFACDPFLFHGLILTWLCSAQVPFTPSTGFFEEIIRFLKNKSSHHQPEKSWFIVKKAGLATIKYV